MQAQLEHPSIVPVYDVGVDPGGALYFTMKRVRGHSLQRVLQDGDASRYSLRKLLTVMARVARTIEYAHRRGVVNRDLKPANIMLGEFDVIGVSASECDRGHVAGPANDRAPRRVGFADEAIRVAGVPRGDCSR